MPTQDSPTCPTCGVPVPANAPELLCPNCLGNAALIEDTGSSDDFEGETIGRYRLLEKIGEGGFGVVYMAEQREPVTRKVALKVIKLGMDTRQVIARFESERQALAMMDHPNIARILDAGATQSGRPYFVMELVRGVPIMRFCQEKKLSQKDRLGLFLDVCAAVQHAHQKGIIHRDLKPNNVLVTMNDDKPMPKIIDFGIAKATSGNLTDQTLFTQFHQFIGTPAYMSPEQAQMNATDVDTRTDIYALGVLLYELLTGTPPFDPDKLQTEGQEAVFRIIREEEPPKPSTRITELRKRAPQSGLQLPNSEVPQDLDWVVMRALEKDRKRRYETANGLALDVQRFLNSEPVSAAAPSAVYQTRKFLARHRTVAVTSGAILASLLVGLVIATIFYAREREARAEVEKREQGLVEANYGHDMQAVAEAFDRGRFTLAESLLKKHLPKPNKTDQREWLWRYRMGQLHREQVRSPRFEKGSLAIAVSPNGRRLARILRGEIQFLSLPSFEIEHSAQMSTSWFGGFFSDDGLQFITRNPSPRVIDLETYEDRALAPKIVAKLKRAIPTPNRRWVISISKVPNQSGRPGPIHTRLTCVSVDSGEDVGVTDLLTECNNYSWENKFRISPNSRFITQCAADRTVRVFKIPSMQEVARLPVQDDANSVAWSPDSRLLAIGYDYPADVELWEVATPTHLQTLKTPFKDPKSDLCFSNDGKRLAAALWGESAVVWDVASGEIADQFVSKVSMVAFLRDGRLLGEERGRVQLFEIAQDAPLTELRSFSGDSELWNLAYSPRGDYLAATARDGIVRLFDPLTEKLIHAFPRRRLPESPRSPYGGAPLAFAPDGRTFVAANGDHTASVLDVVTREERFLFNGHTGSLSQIAISSDGAIVATTSHDIMIVWDLKTGEEVERSLPKRPKPVDFSPVLGSKLLAYGDREGFGIRDLADPDGMAHYQKISAPVWAVKFTPDGKQLIVGREAAESWLYDVETFQRIGSLPPVAGQVALSHSPNGRNLAMPTWAWGVQLWQMQTGLSLGQAPFPEPGAWVYSAEFSPDGNTLAISTRKFGVHLLRAPSWKEIEAWLE